MSHERLGAFNDAMLAIVMTIIVLEFEVPDPLTTETLFGMWREVFAYGGAPVPRMIAPWRRDTWSGCATIP